MSGTMQVISGKGAVRALPRESQTYVLQEQQLMRVRDGKGAQVRVLAGAVWVTQDYDSRDVVLKAGEAFVLDRNGTAVLHPLGRGPVRLALGDVCAQERHAYACASPAAA